MNGRIVIVGGGIAGVQAAFSLAGSWEVSLVLGEDFLPYYRMRIEEIIAGTAPESLYIHPAGWYEEKGIRLCHSKASSIDRDKHSVKLEEGSVLPYDKLILATGSNAFVFPLEGRRSSVFSLRSAADAIAIRKTLDGAGSFTVIGGGLLGLELAHSIAAGFSIAVNVIESAEHILPRQLDKDSALLLQKKLEEDGVHIYAGAKAVSADDHTLRLSDGTDVPSDILCFSAGVRAECSLASQAGLRTDKGIIVDAHLRTSDPDIFAIGDAAELDGRTFGLAMHAREMGSKAASIIGGDTSPYVPSEPSAMLKVAGIDVASFGRITDESDVIIDSDASRCTIFTENGIVRGAVLINSKALMMKVKNAIGKPFSESFPDYS